jgi:hypothetical protein
MEGDISDSDFQPYTSNEQHFISKGELSDLARDFNSFKSQIHFLGSWLQGCNLLHQNTTILNFRCQQKGILLQLMIWYNVQNRIMAELGQGQKTNEW